MQFAAWVLKAIVTLTIAMKRLNAIGHAYNKRSDFGPGIYNIGLFWLTSLHANVPSNDV
jgi:hypothetical protein